MDNPNHPFDDQRIRQKLDGLDTPPPQTSWQPGQSWEKLQSRLATGKPTAAFRPLPWYYAAAAALLILLVPFGVMLADIRRQQAQIEQLAAELAKQGPQPVSGEARLSRRQSEAPTRVSQEPAPGREIAPGKATGRNTDARNIAPRKQTFSPKPDPAPEEMFAHQPVAARVRPEREERKITAPEEILPAGQVRIVISRPKRKGTSVTLHFPAEEAVRPESSLALESENPPQKRPFRVFTRRPDAGDSPPVSPESFIPVLSAKIK